MEHAIQELGPTVVHQAGYLWLIPLFPAIGALINSLFGIRIQRAMGKRWNHGIAIGMMILSFLVALRAFAQMYSPAGQRAVPPEHALEHAGRRPAAASTWHSPSTRCR